MHHILILLTLPDEISRKYRDHLRDAFPELRVDLIDHHSKAGPFLETADILLTFGGMTSDQLFEDAGGLAWVQALGTGMDGIIDRPTLRDGVLLTNMRGIHGAPVSEAAICAMLALSRDLPQAIRNQGKRVWHRFMPTLVKDKTVGILGIGVIAEELAPKCKALGMRVIGITSTVREVPGFDEIRSRDELEQVAGELDYFVILAPYSRETHGIVGTAVLGAMKPSGYLINVSRAGVVDDDALIEVLGSGRIAGAALDVFTEEPLPEDSPLWEMANVLITPKQGGYCDVYVDYALPIIEANLRHYLAGDTDAMINIVER